MGMIDSLLPELERESATTRRVLERVPGDQLSWRPHAKSMSLGQLALHLASLPKNIVSMALVDAYEPSGFAAKEAESVEQLLETFDQGLAFAKEKLAGLDDAYLFQNWSMLMGGQPIMTLPRVGVLRSILLNHSYHHRGQLSVYLRLLDIAVPSIYGPSADENPFG